MQKKVLELRQSLTAEEKVTSNCLPLRTRYFSGRVMGWLLQEMTFMTKVVHNMGDCPPVFINVDSKIYFDLGYVAHPI